ncbi:MAG: rubrerythrin family protein [Candidatus Ranarchaeia archaeon]
MAAFAGESQANRKYLAFAKKAEKEGYQQIANLFRAVAASETIHAHNHLRVAGAVKTTQENLAEAMEGEKYEITSMYPSFVEQAAKEGDKNAERSFKWALETEKIHKAMYEQALDH